MYVLQDVCKSMAEKIGFDDPEEDCLCFSLNECIDGVTSEAGRGAGHPERVSLRVALSQSCARARTEAFRATPPLLSLAQSDALSPLRRRCSL